jgi:hypothetical protein
MNSGGDVAVDKTGGRRLPPLFNPDFLDALPQLAPPPIGRRLVGERLARSRLESIAVPLRTALSRYAGRLHAWGTTQLEELTAPAAEATASPGATHSELAALDAVIDSASS